VGRRGAGGEGFARRPAHRSRPGRAACGSTARRRCIQSTRCRQTSNTHAARGCALASAMRAKAREWARGVRAPLSTLPRRSSGARYHRVTTSCV